MTPIYLHFVGLGSDKAGRCFATKDVKCLNDRLKDRHAVRATPTLHT
jgi:hypothetical protein